MKLAPGYDITRAEAVLALVGIGIACVITVMAADLLLGGRLSAMIPGAGGIREGLRLVQTPPETPENPAANQ